MEKERIEELKQLAKGVFADDKKATHYNVDASARFLTDEQFDKLDAEDKKGFVKITNPAFEVAEEINPQTNEAGAVVPAPAVAGEKKPKTKTKKPNEKQG